jgi:hypothetical protein
MNHDQFTYWLQGFVEMNGGKEPTKSQWKMIKDHLNLCFCKITPLTTQEDMNQFLRLEQIKAMRPYATNPYIKFNGQAEGGGAGRNGGGGGC